jgi:hypothetical protein
VDFYIDLPEKVTIFLATLRELETQGEENQFVPTEEKTRVEVATSEPNFPRTIMSLFPPCVVSNFDLQRVGPPRRSSSQRLAVCKEELYVLKHIIALHSWSFHNFGAARIFLKQWPSRPYQISSWLENSSIEITSNPSMPNLMFRCSRSQETATTFVVCVLLLPAPTGRRQPRP